MRQTAARSLYLLLCMVLFMAFAPGVVKAAQDRPYFKTFGGDVMTGGWFSESSTCNTSTTSKYQDANNTASDPLVGGIITYAKSSGSPPNLISAGGASSQFAAFVLGRVDANQASRFGFSSNGAMGDTSVKGRTFANNQDSLTFGGLFQDSNSTGVRQGYCMPDYYSKRPNPMPAGSTLASGSFPATSGIYSANGTVSPHVLNSAGLTLPLGSNITVYVDGNVYIGGNIRYNAADVDATINNVPKFALVVRGSIYIDPSVTELYGFYIAQPNPANASAVTADEGIIWTCHPNNTNPIPYTYPATDCRNKLTITGGLAAKQINFLRTNGDVDEAAASTSEGMGSANIAEVINYSPAIPLGGPFFVYPGSDTIRNRIDSVRSLPPVF